MSLTLPYPTLTTTTAVRAELQDNFTTVAAKFGQVDNEDIRANANIDVDKLSAQYEYWPVSVRLADGTAANEYLVPMYNDGNGDWTVVATQWATADTGTNGAGAAVA